MSASGAAPLPRLGEVFFDVRGDSRSMRLSWYADTGVAVFSIWQGGVCTGTFRLPMGDLDRMIEILERGPQRRLPQPGGRGASDYGAEDFGAADYGAAGYGDAGYENADYRDTDYGPADYGVGRQSGSAADYPARGYSDRELPTGTYWRDEGGYQPDATGQGRFAESDESGYDQDRFVPPYVRPEGTSYPNDNPGASPSRRRGVDQPAYPSDRWPGSSQSERYPEAPRSPAGYFDGSDYRLLADPGSSARHSAGSGSGQ